MAAYAAVVSLMNTILDIINHPRISTFFDNKQIHHLLQKTNLLLDFIEANNYGGVSKEADELEMEIASAAQAAEDVIDLHIMDQIYAETSTPYWLDLQQKIEDMEGVMKRADEFKGKQRWREEQRTPLLPLMEIEETSMVGLDAELESLLDKLTREPQSSRKTISIVGMGGTGKTTLAKSIFESKLIKEYFDFRGWATISQHHNAQQILAQLLSQAGKSSHGSVNELGEQLHKYLFGRRFFIILDDIWNVNAWDEVRCFFPDNRNGSRIVLTTRLSNVANDCGSSPFMMRFLDEASSWKLFCEKAFKNESCPPKQREVGEEYCENSLETESCPPELHEVGEEIVKLCKGLALSIVVMGGLLSKSPRTVEYWEGILKDIKSLSKESLDVLSLSYTHLPAHLKPCFLYMGVFEEDFEIRVSEVVKLWVAEGFIKPNGWGNFLEEIGEGYIKDLVERNLILVVNRGRNKKIKSCGIHDLVRDLCIKLGEQQQFFSVNDGKKTPNSDVRRLTGEYANYVEDQVPLARSILAMSFCGKPIKKGSLRVYKNSIRVHSPVELYGNVNLRHLAYQRNYSPYSWYQNSTWELPTCVSLVWNLQNLIIDGNSQSELVVAPTEIWKMRQLKHVVCPMIYLPPFNGQDEDELLNLQTLKTTYNLRLCAEVCKMIPDITTLYIYYDDDWYGYDDCLIEYLCNLDRLHKLESLQLSIKSRRWASPDAKLNKKLAFPNSLKKLSLDGCGFHWDDLRVIGSLPLLEVLILHKYTFSEGDRWSPITGQFLRLKVLDIHGGDHTLEYWDADNSHFPVLEELILWGMDNLKEIPLGIGDIPTLELIRVHDCSMSAAISALKIKEDQLDIGNYTLQIHVTVHASKVEYFKEMVESEGLCINNIQLEVF